MQHMRLRPANRRIHERSWHAYLAGSGRLVSCIRLRARMLMPLQVRCSGFQNTAQGKCHRCYWQGQECTFQLTSDGSAGALLRAVAESYTHGSPDRWLAGPAPVVNTGRGTFELEPRSLHPQINLYHPATFQEKCWTVYTMVDMQSARRPDRQATLGVFDIHHAETYADELATDTSNMWAGSPGCIDCRFGDGGMRHSTNSASGTAGRTLAVMSLSNLVHNFNATPRQSQQ